MNSTQTYLIITAIIACTFLLHICDRRSARRYRVDLIPEDTTLATLEKAERLASLSIEMGKYGTTAADLKRFEDELIGRCTCPSGDGALTWPCPAHPPAPAVAQVCKSCTWESGPHCPTCGEPFTK